MLAMLRRTAVWPLHVTLFLPPVLKPLMPHDANRERRLARRRFNPRCVCRYNVRMPNPPPGPCMGQQRRTKALAVSSWWGGEAE